MLGKFGDSKYGDRKDGVSSSTIQAINVRLYDFIGDAIETILEEPPNNDAEWDTLINKLGLDDYNTLPKNTRPGSNKTLSDTNSRKFNSAERKIIKDKIKEFRNFYQKEVLNTHSVMNRQSVSNAPIFGSRGTIPKYPGFGEKYAVIPQECWAKVYPIDWVNKKLRGMSNAKRIYNAKKNCDGYVSTYTRKKDQYNHYAGNRTKRRRVRRLSSKHKRRNKKRNSSTRRVK
jgi:hypothetical protein